jgi:uncharacterized damage-inducible protein DinB
MKKRLIAVLVLLCSCFGAIAQEQSKSAKGKDPRPSVTNTLRRDLSMLENDFVPAAEAMPEDKYDFAPTTGEFKGVRTFAQQVKHVAATNMIVAAALLQEKPPIDPKLDNGPDDIKSKADILKFLKDSFALAHKATATVNDKNASEMITSAFDPKSKTTRLAHANILTWHSFDHYGQMVVYLRMNGIIPPASRQQ